VRCYRQFSLYFRQVRLANGMMALLDGCFQSGIGYSHVRWWAVTWPFSSVHRVSLLSTRYFANEWIDFDENRHK